MAKCAYVVYYVPEGCTEFTEGEVIYTDCPESGICNDLYFDEEPCRDAWLFSMSCQCIEE